MICPPPPHPIAPDYKMRADRAAAALAEYEFPE